MNARILTSSIVAVVLATASFSSSAMAGGCHTGGYGGGYSRGGSYGHGGGHDYGHGHRDHFCEYENYYQGHCLPALGFRSNFVRNLGERVTFVHCDSIAYCMGLLRGDVILTFNGCPLNCRNDFYVAYYQALCNGGYIEWTVRRHCGRIDVLTYQFPGYAPVAVPAVGGPLPAGPAAIPAVGAPVAGGPVVPAGVAGVPAGLPQGQAAGQAGVPQVQAAGQAGLPQIPAGQPGMPQAQAVAPQAGLPQAGMPQAPAAPQAGLPQAQAAGQAEQLPQGQTELAPGQAGEPQIEEVAPEAPEASQDISAPSSGSLNGTGGGRNQGGQFISTTPQG